MSDCTEIYRLKLSTDRKKKDFFKSTGEYENNKKNLEKKQRFIGNCLSETVLDELLQQKLRIISRQQARMLPNARNKSSTGSSGKRKDGKYIFS